MFTDPDDRTLALLKHLDRAFFEKTFTTGTLVIVRGEGGGKWLGVGRQLQAMMLSPFVGQKLGTFVMSPKQENLLVLRELVESGQLTPVIDRTYPLSETATAVQYMTDGQARGKVVITV